VVEITVEEAKGHVSVLAGAGGYNTAEVIERATNGKWMVADGILFGDAVITTKPSAGRVVPALQGDRGRGEAA